MSEGSEQNFPARFVLAPSQNKITSGFRMENIRGAQPIPYLKVCVVYMFKNQSRGPRLKQKKALSLVEINCFHLG